MRKGLRASAVGILSLALTGCGLKDPDPFDPRSLMRPEREASRETRGLYMPPLPTTGEDLLASSATTEATSQPGSARRVRLKPVSRATTGPSLTERPIARLSLQEIMHRAVVNNHEVRVAGYDAAVSKTRILEATAHFDPVAFSKLTYTDQKILSPAAAGGSPVLNPFTPEVFRTLDMQVGMRQNLASGGQVELHYDVQRIQRANVGPTTLNPYTLDDLALQITQPLFREFGYDVNWARVNIARSDYHVSVLDFRKALEDNLAELERNYWQLQEAEQEVAIQEDLLRLSRETYRILVERPQDIAYLQTLQAKSSLEARQTVLFRAKAKIGDASDDIKRRMNDPEFPVGGDVLILTSTPPIETPVQFDFADLVNTALANRFELGQQQWRLKSADIAADVAKNNLLPKLSLTGTIDVQGPGRNIGYAFQNQGRSDYIGATIGFELEWPLGNREARAIYRRAMLQRLQAIEQYRNLVDTITQNVKTTMREVETSWNEIGGRRRALFAVTEEMAGFERKIELGQLMDLNFVNQLLDVQERMADAQKEEKVAVASYCLALAGLERAKGTLLRYNNIVMEEDKFVSTEK